MPKKIIYSIFFSPDGNLPESVYEGLREWKENIHVDRDTEIIFITQLDKLNLTTRKILDKIGITIQDVSTYRKSPNFHEIEYFLQAAYKSGDRCAFALASDILRFSVIQLAAEQDLLFYADINDSQIDFEQLNKLTIESFRANTWGFAFPTLVIDTKKFGLPQLPGRSHPYALNVRNDVLIAHKATNPNFWKYFLAEYEQQIIPLPQRYCDTPPTNTKEARAIAAKTALPNGWSNLNHKDVYGAIIPTTMTFTPRRVIEKSDGLEGLIFWHSHKYLDANSFVRVKKTRSGGQWLPEEERQQQGSRKETENIGMPIAEFSEKQLKMIEDRLPKASVANTTTAPAKTPLPGDLKYTPSVTPLALT